ncbi:hypothetical protein SY88_09895 [Clostridiales bacterium PH28_bin88]|nr:hypothetical protein SY88_09895 [Clostridiales bacterium PH28_bin88]
MARILGVLVLAAVLVFAVINLIVPPGLAPVDWQRLSEKVSPRPALEVERLLTGNDQDNDGLDDLEDILQGARKEVESGPVYRSAYYAGGYPPDDEGVCTDLVWRAFREAGYNLKEMVDRDIGNNQGAYPRVAGKPDPNIDFRRVQNLAPFFTRHATSLTTEVVPWDAENLKEWQGGDIVIYGAPLWHIGIVSDRRREDGVPLLIHNGGYAAEEDRLLTWPSPMLYHFRFPKQ